MVLCVGFFFFLGGGPFYYLEKCSSTFAGPFISINSIINSTPIAEFKVKFENKLSLSFFFFKRKFETFYSIYISYKTVIFLVYFDILFPCILYLILMKNFIICKLSFARNGVDRSGLFVAASCIVERIKCDREVDVFQSIKQMRQNRSQLICNMVSWAVLEVTETR